MNPTRSARHRPVTLPAPDPATVAQLIQRHAAVERRSCSSGTAPTTRATKRPRWSCIVAGAARTSDAADVYSPPRQRRERARVEALIERRIDERMPPAYLTHETWFAGLPFYVDERVLIPRSPIAELIERRFAPWIDAARVRRILDIGTGSGCIAHRLREGVSARARRRGGHSTRTRSRSRRSTSPAHCVLTRRVRLVESGPFRGAFGERYLRYHREQSALCRRRARCAACRASTGTSRASRSQSGRDGLDSVATILRGAGRHLRPRGLLVVEVGNTERLLARAFPKLPFTWLDFERGGGGVFLLTRRAAGDA